MVPAISPTEGADPRTPNDEDLDLDINLDIDDSPEEAAHGPPVDGNARNGTSPGDPDAAIEHNTLLAKTKRIACTICRRRKLRCNGARPSCSTCARLGHACAYDEVRRKSGPKRGYVKALEERLKQVETLLRTRESGQAAREETVAGGDRAQPQTRQRPSPAAATAAASSSAAATGNFGIANPSIGITSDKDMDRWLFSPESPQAAAMDEMTFTPTMPTVPLDGVNNITWEMIGLGLKEPLPAQETIDHLHHIYFTKVHPTVPMIHRPRYLAAMDLPPNRRPPVSLRYAMWTLASTISDEYHHCQDLFYKRARKYIEAESAKGFGEHLISTAIAQAYVLLAMYEYRMMYFPRAWMSTGSAVRLAQMVGLHRIDGAALEVKACMPPPGDWTEREERRRTFWAAFAMDKYASIGTGWPMSIDERDITTNMPASESAFELGRPEQTATLAESMTPSGASKLSSLGSVVLLAALLGRNLTHLHRSDPGGDDADLDGEFWKRHRQLDNILLNTALCLPPSLRLPDAITDPNAVWTNMCIHTSTICLHQAAIFKADKNRLPVSISAESKSRCISAAKETAGILRLISHTDLTTANPWMAFALYVAARVFVQYLGNRPNDGQTIDTLNLLITAMAVLKRRNPITESFMVQLDVDLESLIAKNPQLQATLHRHVDAELAQRNSGATKPSGVHRDGGGSSSSCNFMSLSRDMPNLTPKPPGAPNNITRLPLDITERPGANHGYDYRSGGGSHSKDDASAAASEASPSNRPTPNSSTASDHRGSGALGYAGPGAQLSPGGTSFNTSPASPHQNLSAAGLDAAPPQAYFPQPTPQMSVFAQSGSLGTNMGDPALLSATGLGHQDQQQQPGGRSASTAQIPHRIQEHGESFAWLREIVGTQAGLAQVPGLMDMASIDQIDMSAWGSAAM